MELPSPAVAGIAVRVIRHGAQVPGPAQDVVSGRHFPPFMETASTLECWLSREQLPPLGRVGDSISSPTYDPGAYLRGFFMSKPLSGNTCAPTIVTVV